MNDKDPRKDPFQWFFNASLLLLFGVVALTMTLQLLGQIWPWLVLIGVIALAAAVGVAVWRSKRQPW